jgi:FkbM family methyltransferase
MYTNTSGKIKWNKMLLKKIVYSVVMSLLKLFWRLRGGRRITAFGERFLVLPTTVFPTYRRKFPLPRGDCKSEIVRYTDFVQLHAICDSVSGIERPIIVDVGAYHGSYAIILAKLVKERGGKIIAIEPDPNSYSIMIGNVRLNQLEDTVICENIAISDQSGQSYLKIDDSQSQLSKGISDGPPCIVSTLTQLLCNYSLKKVDLLIIDVEGAELPVLRSYPWESIMVGKIFCELHPYAWKNFNYGGEDFQRFILEHNFRVVDMYLKEHKVFDIKSYIGPTLFLPDFS